MLDSIKKKALQGIPASVEECLVLNESYKTEALCEAADEVRRTRCGKAIDTCSIVNARSGRCGEDCKWCAQSAHYNTGVEEYEMVPTADALKAVKINIEQGVKRLSLVTSGRRIPKQDMDRFCSLYKIMAKEGKDLYMCASMGLLDKEALAALKEAGVKRYHCNLETSSSYFPKLCSTHTHEDKLRTIKAALEVGLEVCSGGIIGMGESMRDRLEMAREAREAGAVSIPVNILNPIAGTPLENVPLIGEDEIIRTVALMRFIAPDAVLRFAGGRARLSDEANRRILRGGMNGALVGDMLTTVGNNLDEDKKLFNDTGFEY